MVKPIEIINSHAAAMTRSMDIVVYAVGGLYEQVAHANPNARGVREFWVKSESIASHAVEGVVNQMRSALIALNSALSDANALRASISSDDIEAACGEAESALYALTMQARQSYAKRLREIASASAFGFDTYQHDPRIMIRSGAKWNFSDYAYLTIRQSLVSWYNNEKIAAYTEQGVKTYTLLSDDSDLMYDHYLVADYPDVAESLFHPRTTKLVGAPYVDS